MSRDLFIFIFWILWINFHIYIWFFSKNKEKYIKISVKLLKNKVRVCVFNTGENITKENIQKIWNRFYKEDSSRNREMGGTGIGLSLVKAIMNNYNNEYGVENKENGVEFYFDINISE